MGGIVEDNLKPILYALFNVLSVTMIVVVNKKVFNEHHFHFPLLLVLIHSIITFLGLRIAAAFGAFEMKSLPQWPRIVLAASFVFYNGASLINLNVNTVGFYQISKILVTPMVMAMNYALYQEGTTTPVKMAVLVMLCGVTMATVTDVDVTAVGFAIGMTAVLGAAQQQILIGKMQKRLQASANQLLVTYTPFVIVMLAILSPLDHVIQQDTPALGVGTYTTWFQQYGSAPALLTIFFSGCCGLLVSLSTFLMIGATSALTYNIVGHLKTVTILTMGVVVFGDSMSTKKLMGIALALTGVIWYSKIKLDLQKLKTEASARLESRPASATHDLEKGNQN
eukprot:m.602766 g.602766  ORF g.602766 m.602766 type:complete len:338 (-) comp22451_c0_seq5:182-1195(-)